ncbi:MAG: tRNA guanosine(15) transglycosylase TgtA [Candidatus Heimdallarchaeota archaeon]|nr:tRNA guanosine(15) transglycosylase TgtA [Candidatus Heimdallarchaeota archaeon]
MFEITSTDLLARKGIIHTTKGDIRTPCFVPVVHPEPSKNFIEVQTFRDKYMVDFIITSSYILRKRFENKITNLHELTNFPGPIMTDSGAYQSLLYGEIELTPKNVIEFQEFIGSDFGVPLDIPISINDSYIEAKAKVEKTIERSRDISSLISNTSIKWVAPIQGGKFIDLVKKSAQELGHIETFDMFAIGSVVEIMNNYMYDTLLEIILTAKQYLDPKKPVHLFGAGHPSIFPFIVAAGCDSFDSAAYALYAQENRYLTNTQTFLLDELDEFPCNCSICSSISPNDMKELKKNERVKLLASHNLSVCQTEIMNIRRAISSGTLWNLLESRSRSHPNLRKGFNILLKHSNLLFLNSPSTKKKGLFFVSDSDLERPEILLHKKRLTELNLNKKKKLIILSILNKDITELYDLFTNLKNIMKNNDKLNQKYEFWILNDYFGIIPLEVSEVFPLSQSVSVTTLSKNQVIKIINNTLDLIVKLKFKEIIFLGELNEFSSILQNHLFFTFNKERIKAYSFSVSKDNFEKIRFILNAVL